MTTQICSRFIFLTLLVSWPALAEIPDPPDPSEQQMQLAEQQGQWVQRFQQASNLLGMGKVAEALASFQSLQADLPDRDSEGLVAVAIGDCQFSLKQYEQARQTYLDAEAKHPELAKRLWVRKTEIDMATGKTATAQATLQQIIESTGNSDTKNWAALRLATVQERQAIQTLQQAQEAYTKVGQIKTESERDSAWARVHAEDLGDAVQQLQTALQQLDSNLMWLATPSGRSNKALHAAEGVQVAKVQIGGTIRRVLGEKDPVELVIGKDGKVEATIGGKKVQIDTATQRQISRHIEQALHLVAQEDN